MSNRTLEVKLEYDWVITDFVFPNAYPHHAYPAIYTWVLTTKDGSKSYYLGETANLTQRIRFYMKPGSTGQETNWRLKGEMEACKKVELYTLELRSLVVNGVDRVENALADADTRKGLERLLTRELRIKKEGKVILNK